MSLNPIQFLDEVIIRSPIYPLKETFLEDDVNDLVNNDFFLEAIYVASPTLYKECLLYKDGLIKEEKEKQKIINALLRYYSRMSTRCTPFGLFSTVGVGRFNNINNNEEEKINEKADFYRHTRFDMYFLQRTVDLFLQMPYLVNHILFYPNNSIYHANKEIRYIEYSYHRDFRKSRISAIVQNQYVSKVLAYSKKGATKDALTKLIIEENIDEATAKNFIEELIKSQVLISEFEVATTSNQDYIHQIFNHLENIYIRSKDWYPLSILDVLKSAVADLKEMDDDPVSKAGAYQKVVDKIRTLQPVIVEGKTFHIDSYRRYDPSTVSIRSSLKKEIVELLQYFLEINKGEVIVNNNVEKFKAKFISRYDSASVPLIETLDSDIGIGYPVNKQKKSSPLVDDIPLGNDEKQAGVQINLSAKEKWLMEILKGQDDPNKYSIHLEDYLIPHKTQFDKNDWGLLPASMSAIFRILDDEQQTLFLEFFTGPSAAPLLARFTYGNKEIRNVVEKVIEHEDSVTENAIYVEMVHLPDDRISNILMHPPFRKYELPYLAIASTDQKDIIPIDDIYIKVESNQIVLFSKSLNKRIIPCKTHMHMHASMNSLPLYHFWGDMQQEYSNQSINFTINNIQSLLNFVPRIYYKKTIISPAGWNLPKQAIKHFEIDNEKNADWHERITRLREKYAIPDQVLFIDGDNELLVNFSDPRSIRNWLKAIKYKDAIYLKEVLWGNIDKTTEKYNHQYVASLLNTTQVKFSDVSFSQTNIPERHFGFGSDWLHLKLYCGIGSSDLILSKIILPMINKVSQTGLITKWFFVKYQDPDYHIRLRFLLSDPDKTNELYNTVNTAISKSDDGFLIWKIQPDIYSREIERYGPASTEVCESIFYIDSSFTLPIIDYLQRKNNTNLAFLIGLRFMDDLLSGLELSLDEKINFVNTFKKAYQTEFETNKNSAKKINEKYAVLKKDIFEILSTDPESYSNKDYQEISPLLKQRKELLNEHLKRILTLKQSQELKVDFYNLISSLIHMTLNRLITHKERLHELLVYEFSYMYYNTIKRNK